MFTLADTGTGLCACKSALLCQQCCPAAAANSQPLGQWLHGCLITVTSQTLKHLCGRLVAAATSHLLLIDPVAGPCAVPSVADRDD
jgi:hypothetical protein